MFPFEDARESRRKVREERPTGPEGGGRRPIKGDYFIKSTNHARALFERSLMNRIEENDPLAATSFINKRR